jgi:uncharacterized protein YjdB
MKTKILFVICLIAAVCGFTACSDDISGSVNVSGDCAVEELTLNDQYKATINTSKRLVKVKVPVDFDQKSDMVITSMKISDGAKASMKVGDSLTLHATVEPDWYDAENLDRHSSDDSVLWVDGYGNITDVGRGKAKITATASRGVSDSCTISVNE